MLGAEAGDFNGWVVDWSCPRTNIRGNGLLEALAALEVTLINQVDEFTFSRNGESSIIDLTFVSSSIVKMPTWKFS